MKFDILCSGFPVFFDPLPYRHMYLLLLSSFEQVPEFSLDATQLKAIILHALQSLHGQVKHKFA